MSGSILATFATRYGSTKEVAEVIAASPLYIGRWLKDIPRFLTLRRQALTERPVAIFTLGPTGSGEQEWQGVRAQLDQELANFPGSRRSQWSCLVANMTRPGCASLIVCWPACRLALSTKCRPAICETGRRYAPGRTAWRPSFSEPDAPVLQSNITAPAGKGGE